MRIAVGQTGGNPTAPLTCPPWQVPVRLPTLLSPALLLGLALGAGPSGREGAGLAPSRLLPGALRVVPRASRRPRLSWAPQTRPSSPCPLAPPTHDERNREPVSSLHPQEAPSRSLAKSLGLQWGERCRQGPHLWDTQRGLEGGGAGSVGPSGPTPILIQKASLAAHVSCGCRAASLRARPAGSPATLWTVTQVEVSAYLRD